MPEISVIVPVYNTEGQLRRCINSILNQSFRNFELILIDDGSTDKSGSICDEYEKNDSRIIVIHQKNHGQASARNRGISIAKGEWIHFVDSDDLIHSQMLELLLKAAKRDGAAMSMCGCYVGENLSEEFYEISKNDTSICHEIDELYMNILFQSGGLKYWCAWAKLIKMDIVKKYLFTEGKICEDNAVVFKWIFHSGRISVIEKKLYYYCIAQDSTMRSKFNEKKLDYLWALDEQIKFYRKMKYYSLYETVQRVYYESALDLYYQCVLNKLSWCIIIKLKANVLLVALRNMRCTINDKYNIYNLAYIFLPHIMKQYKEMRGK